MVVVGEGHLYVFIEESSGNLELSGAVLIDVAIEVQLGFIGHNDRCGGLGDTGEVDRHCLCTSARQREGGSGLACCCGTPCHGDVDSIDGFGDGDVALVNGIDVIGVSERGGDVVIEFYTLHIHGFRIGHGGISLEREVSGCSLDGRLICHSEDILYAGKGIDFTVAEV